LLTKRDDLIWVKAGRDWHMAAFAARRFFVSHQKKAKKQQQVRAIFDTGA
jgi:hypothetical protein